MSKVARTRVNVVCAMAVCTLVQVAVAQTPSFVWAKSFGGPGGSSRAWDVAVDSGGNVYATGSFNGTVDFFPGSGTHNLTSSGSHDAYICKLDASGGFQWAGHVGGPGQDEGLALAVDSSGNLYAAGQSSLLPGIVGAMMSAFIITRALVGKQEFDTFIRKGLNR